MTVVIRLVGLMLGMAVAAWAQSVEAQARADAGGEVSLLPRRRADVRTAARFAAPPFSPEARAAPRPCLARPPRACSIKRSRARANCKCRPVRTPLADRAGGDSARVDRFRAAATPTHARRRSPPGGRSSSRCAAATPACTPGSGCRSPHADPARHVRSHRTAARSRRTSTRSSTIPIRRRTANWSTGCWPRRIMASAGDGTGSTWSAMPTPAATKRRAFSQRLALSRLRDPLVQ